VYSTASAHHARSRAIVASSFAVGSSRLGATVRAAAARAEVPGFFALAAVTSTLRATCHPPEGRSGRGLPAPIGWGSNEEAMPRARDVAPRVGPPVSTLTFLAAEPGPGVPSSVFGALRRRDPTRLPRTQSAAGGPVTEPRSWTIQIAGHHHRGPASAFRPPRAVAPLREVNDSDPVRALCLPVAWRCAPRWALRLSLGAPPRCFESASTTDVLLTSTRRENTLSGDCPPSAVGNPPAFCFEILPNGASPPSFARTPDHLAVIRPPAAPCLTARRRLRVERLSHMRSRVVLKRSDSFFGCQAPRRSNL